MYISPKASLAPQREAHKARDNRAGIVKTLSHKWGLFTATGALALKNGLSSFAFSPFARSAFARCRPGRSSPINAGTRSSRRSAR
jgi:hypothetical protein